MKNEEENVRKVLQKFQKGYTERNIKVLDNFMEDIFIKDDNSIITGTGYREWTFGFEQAKILIRNDWEHWGDICFDFKDVNINIHGEVCWITTVAICEIKRDIEKHNLELLGWIKDLIDEKEAIYQQQNPKDRSTKDKLFDILYTSAMYLRDSNEGTKFIYPLRFSAVLLKQNCQWKFHSMHFSFPNEGHVNNRFSGIPKNYTIRNLTTTNFWESKKEDFWG